MVPSGAAMWTGVCPVTAVKSAGTLAMASRPDRGSSRSLIACSALATSPVGLVGGGEEGLEAITAKAAAISTALVTQRSLGSLPCIDPTSAEVTGTSDTRRVVTHTTAAWHAQRPVSKMLPARVSRPRGSTAPARPGILPGPRGTQFHTIGNTKCRRLFADPITGTAPEPGGRTSPCPLAAGPS
jgi:hypothetical protein